jgi:hypothetical protein
VTRAISTSPPYTCAAATAAAAASATRRHRRMGGEALRRRWCGLRADGELEDGAGGTACMSERDDVCVVACHKHKAEGGGLVGSFGWWGGVLGALGFGAVLGGCVASVRVVGRKALMMGGKGKWKT